MAIAIDTLAYARRLREAGFSAQQAEGQAEALAAAMTDTLATKQDLSEFGTRMEAGFAAVRHEIRELETRMDARLRELELRIDARSADLERRITLRMGTMMVAGFGVMSALVSIL